MHYVYHASKIKGLQVIEPRVSTHGISWVYAMQSRETAAVFAADFNDLMIQVGFLNGKMYLMERFQGAFEYVYKNKKCSVYTLDASSFEQGKTSFKAELVSSDSCKAIEEFDIEDLLEYIGDLEGQGKIDMYRYPNHPLFISDPKNDLIETSLLLLKIPGNRVSETLQRHHPDIWNEIKSRLESDTMV